MELFLHETDQNGLRLQEIEAALVKSLEGRKLSKVLIIPPDFTRFHSQAGLITSIYYHLLTKQGVQVDIMPALGTHEPVSKAQWEIMFKGIPYENMIVHDWRHDVVRVTCTPRRVAIRSASSGRRLARKWSGQFSGPGGAA